MRLIKLCKIISTSTCVVQICFITGPKKAQYGAGPHWHGFIVSTVKKNTNAYQVQLRDGKGRG